MGHYCRICGLTRPDEKFTGKGHRTHVCQDCARMPKANRVDKPLIRITICRGQTMAATFRDKLGSAAVQGDRYAVKESAS